jgi:hypothetical protein
MVSGSFANPLDVIGAVFHFGILASCYPLRGQFGLRRIRPQTKCLSGETLPLCLWLVDLVRKYRSTSTQARGNPGVQSARYLAFST